MQLTEQQQRVWEFAKDRHKTQPRKYTTEPYHVHLWGVAETLFPFTDDPLDICIAFLHDVIEDYEYTKCTWEDLISFLSTVFDDPYDVAYIIEGVNDLTDEYTHEKWPDMNREARKALEAKRLSKIDYRFQSIKYADFIDNITSIAKHDPGFAKTYIQEKIRILDGMRGGNVNLLIGACAALAEAEKTIRQST